MSQTWKWGFTPGERSALLLICAAVLVGLGYRAFQQHRTPVVPPLTAQDSIMLAAIAEAVSPDGSITAEPADTACGGLLDINTATSEQLEELPGIGPALAGRILAARDSLGGFKEAEELLTVRGIGPKRLDKIRPLVTCSRNRSR